MPHALRLLVAVLLLSGLFARGVSAAELAEVFIDARDPAFVVVQGVAVDAPEAAKLEMRGYAALDRVEMLTWDTFRLNAQTLLGPYVVKNEYPGSRTVLGVLALVKAHPGKPFAVTWNGGLAASFQDFQYAVTTYEAFATDPDAYETKRSAERVADPLNPDRQLQALLNR